MWSGFTRPFADRDEIGRLPHYFNVYGDKARHIHHCRMSAEEVCDRTGSVHRG
jgi:hypothetical protein